MTEQLKITADETKLVVELPDGPVQIERHRNEMQLITGYLQPIVPIEGVIPVGELEVLDSLGDDEYLVVDMRDPDWRRRERFREAYRFRLARLLTVWTCWDVCSRRPGGIATEPRKSLRFATVRPVLKAPSRCARWSITAFRRKTSITTAAACRTGLCWA